MFAFSQVLRLRVLLVAGLIAATSLSLISVRATAQPSPPSRPILFVHGWCGSAYDWAPLLQSLIKTLPSALFTSNGTVDKTVYIIEYNSYTDAYTFFKASGQNGTLKSPFIVDTSDIVAPANIPSSARLFVIQFYDPWSNGTDPANVTKISVLNKAYEIKKVVEEIKLITNPTQGTANATSVNIVAHSMGGLDARAYVENMASKGQCYNYADNYPYYFGDCAPGASDATYANDVANIITIDTPHYGSPLAATLDPGTLLILVAANLQCQAWDSTNRIELSPLAYGGYGLLESLNYESTIGSGSEPTMNIVPIQAIANSIALPPLYSKSWTGLPGDSDDIVPLSSQGAPAIYPSNSAVRVVTTPISHSQGDWEFASNSDCWIAGNLEPMLHNMKCIGALSGPQTQITAQLKIDNSLWLNSWSNTPTVSQGNPVTINYSALDSGNTTLSSVTLWRAPNNNNDQPGVWTSVVTKPISGTQENDVLTDPSPGSGVNWYVADMLDSSGNEARAPIPVQVTVSPVATTPTAHFKMSGGGSTANDGETLTLTVASGGSVPVTFTCTSTQGLAAIQSYIWKANGYQNCPGSGSTCTQSFGPGGSGQFTAAIALVVTDSNSKSATAYGTLVVNTQSASTTATPTFSLASGTYTGTQTVSLSDATPGATIYYTVDGSTPTTSSNVRSTPFTLPSGTTVTLKAIAQAAGYATSAVATASYTINYPLPTVTGVGFIPSNVMNSGSSATVTIQLSWAAPSGGAVVSLSSNNTSAFPVQSTVTVLAGQNSASFSTQAGAVSSTTYVTVTATYNGSSQQTNVIVNPAAQAPTVITGLVSSITATSATLNGSVNPNGADTHYWFLYGTNSTLSGATQTPVPSFDSGGPGNTVIATSVFPSGLSAGTKYYYELVAQNSYGTIPGAILSFTTSAAPLPTVIGISASPTTVIGGSSTLILFTVQLSGPAPSGGASITLTSSNSSILPVGPVPAMAGNYGGAASYATNSVSTVTTVTVTATYNGSSQQTNVTVNPAAKTTPVVNVMPVPFNLTTAQAMVVTVSVGANSGSPTPTGTVCLTATNVSECSVLTNGSATFNIPAGTLPVGINEPLTSTYTPDSNSSSIYNSATGSNPVTVTAVNTPPVLAISGISPAFASAGGAAFPLTVIGSGFTTGSTVYWGTSALTTTYVSTTQLTAQVPAANIVTGGITVTISVITPSPGGGTSNSFQFEVDSASGSTTGPTFSSVTQTVTGGSPASYPVTLPSTVESASVTCLNLPTGAACNYSATTNTLTITTSSSTPKGTYQITVVFTETVSGAASGYILLPILLLPLVYLRKKLATRGVWMTAGLVLVLLAAAAYTSGCGGGGSTQTYTPPPATHQVISSGSVGITIQ